MWEECWDEDSGHAYYYNVTTQESSWEKPLALVESAGPRCCWC